MMKNMETKIIHTKDYICVSLLDKTMKTYVAVGIAECSLDLYDKDVYYFNRLYVGVKHRRKGYGTHLLKTLLQIIDENNYTLILDINPYGEMSYKDLEKFYMKYGFKKYIKKQTDKVFCSYIYNKGVKNMGQINHELLYKVIRSYNFCIVVNDEQIALDACLHEDKDGKQFITIASELWKEPITMNCSDVTDKHFDESEEDIDAFIIDIISDFYNDNVPEQYKMTY